MKIWKVTTKFYDNGVVKANIETIEADEMPTNSNAEHMLYDEYCDYFTDQETATKFFDSAKEA